MAHYLGMTMKTKTIFLIVNHSITVTITVMINTGVFHNQENVV